jgi:gas vesicle protein
MTYGANDSTAEGRALAFLCGALLGASAALLFAPMRGTELRESLGDAARQSRDRLRRLGESGNEWAADRLNRAGDMGRSMLHRASEAVDTAVDRAQSAVNQGAAKAHEATERARTAANRGTEAARTAAKDLDQTAREPMPNPRPEKWS